MNSDGRLRGAIAEARDRLARARRIVALTGPGLNDDAEVPSFSPCGSRLGGRPVAEVAAPGTFFEDPAAVWSWYGEARARLARKQPAPAHRALAALARGPRRLTLATENVDGLHRLAGDPSVIELRGSIWQVRCTRCGARSVNREVPMPALPSCPVCTGLLRPDIVWAGERILEGVLVGCYEALSSCDILIVAGSPGRLQPAASFVRVARRAGALVVETAPLRPEGGSVADLFLPGPADEVLPLILG